MVITKLKIHIDVITQFLNFIVQTQVLLLICVNEYLNSLVCFYRTMRIN